MTLRRATAAVAAGTLLFVLATGTPVAADGTSQSEAPPVTSTANGGSTVIVTQSTQTEPALGGAVASQPTCSTYEINPYAVVTSNSAAIYPYEPVPGSGRYLRAWYNCSSPTVPRILLDVSPEETADAVWAQTIAEIPVAVFELNPSVEWGAIVKVPNWVYAGANIKPFIQTGGFAANQITIRVAPRAMTVDWGDSVVQTCAGLGVAYDSVTHPVLLREQVFEIAPPEACTHAYKHHSGKQPGGAYPVIMSIIWDATWTSAAGQSGTFAPYTQTTTVNMKADQIQIIGGKAP
jgi:hypothetical protein